MFKDIWRSNRAVAFGAALSRQGWSRREVLVGSLAGGAAASTAMAGSVAADIIVEALTSTSLDDRSWRVSVKDPGAGSGVATWVLAMKAFGPGSALQLLTAAGTAVDTSKPSDELTKGGALVISGASWPGLGVGYQLSLRFALIKGQWIVTAHADFKGDLPRFTASATLLGFLQRAVKLSALTPPPIAALRAAGWKPKDPVGWVALAWDRDLQWEIEAPEGLVGHDGLLQAVGVVIAVHSAGGGPLAASLETVPTGALSSITAVSPSVLHGTEIAAGDLRDGRTIRLRPDSFTKVIGLRWADSPTSVWGFTGDWRVLFDKARAFRGVNGLVLEGPSDLVASLPLSDAPHAVGTPAGPAIVHGAGPDHRLALRVREGVVTHFEVRALIAHLGVPLPGADYSRLEFSGMEAVFLLDWARDAAPASAIFSFGDLGRWRVPLTQARLKVERAADLLSLNYRFKGLCLEGGFGGGSVRPLPGQEEPPILVAEFPPQHVLEKAYLRQVQTETGAVPLKPRDPIDPRTVPAALTGGAPPPDVNSTAQDPFDDLVEARLSGPTRLAFALPAERSAWTKQRGKGLRFDLDSLTDWARLELVVARKADAPVAADGRPVTDVTAILRYFDVVTGRLPGPRLDSVLNSVLPPGEFETAIELPARLVLSPGRAGRFEASRAPAQPTGRGPNPVGLWTARLRVEGELAQSSLRAIWSPDFRKEAFYPNGTQADRSTTVPWSEPPLPDGTARLFRTSLSAYDRSELVALTTLWGLPTLPRREAADTSFVSKDRRRPDNVEPPAAWLLADIADGEQGVYLPPAIDTQALALTSLGGSFEVDGAFEPPAAPYLKGNKALFPALSVETWKHRTTLSRDVTVEIVYKGFLVPTGHRAALVKRTERRVVADGNGEHPVAYLIQRFFLRITHPERAYPRVGHPFAARDFPTGSIRLKTTRTPDILDPDSPSGSAWTHGVVKGLVAKGNGLVFWPSTRDEQAGVVRFEVTVDGQASPVVLPMLFVDSTAAHDATTVRNVVDYYNSVAPGGGLNVADFAGAPHRYAPETRLGETTFSTARWVVGVRGRVDRGAPDAPDSRAYVMDSAMEGADQPPWYPFMREGHVQISPIQRFSDRTADRAVVSFDADYVRFGLDPVHNPGSLYLGIHGYVPSDPAQRYSAQLDPVRLDLNGKGDRSGGVGRPDIVAVALSRANGPVGGQTPPERGALPVSNKAWLASGAPATIGSSAKTAARSGGFDPLDFFASDAKLLGIISFGELIKLALMATAPKLKEQLSAAEASLQDQVDKLSTYLGQTAEPILRDLAKSLATADQAFDRPIAAEQTARMLYPGLAGALDAATQAAQDCDTTVGHFGAGATLDNVLDVVKAFETLNGAVSNLVMEIDRVASDPAPEDLKALIADVGAAVTTLKRFGPGILLQPALALVDQAFGSLCADVAGDLSPWMQLAFGPRVEGDLVSVCASLPSITTMNGAQLNDARVAVTKLAADAVEGLAYETLGQPLLGLLQAAFDMREQADAALQGDLQHLVSSAVTLAMRIADGAQALARTPGLAKVLTKAGLFCKQVNDAINGLVVDAGTALAAPDATLQHDLDAAADMVTAIAQLESDATAKLAELRELLQAAPVQGADAADKIKLIVDRVTVAVTAIHQLRQSAGDGISRLRASLSALERQRQEVEKASRVFSDACATPDNMRLLLQGASLWMNLRLQAIRDIQSLALAASTQLNSAIGLGDLQTAPLNALTPGPLADATIMAQAIVADAWAAAKTHVQSVSSVGTVLQNLCSVRDPAALGCLQSETLSLLKGGGEAASDIQTRLDALTNASTSVAKALKTSADALKAPWIDHDPIADAKGRVHLLGDAAAATGIFSREQERALLGLIAGVTASVDGRTQDILLQRGRPLFAAVVSALHDAHVQTDTAVQTLSDGLKAVGGNQVEAFLGAKVEDLLSPSSAARTALAKDRNTLENAQTLLNQPIPDIGGAWRALQGFLDYANAPTFANRPGLVQVVEAAAGLADTLVHGRLQDIVDVGALRNALLASLLKPPFTTLDVSFDFTTAVHDVPPFFTMSPPDRRERYGGDPDAPDLKLQFHMTVDLTRPGAQQVKSLGVLQPFQIKIFDVVKLFFRQATFSSESGGSPQVDVHIADVELGAAVSFIEALQQWLSPGSGSGFFLTPRFDPPGIEAGYILDLGTVSLGDVSFINVNFTASIDIPFVNGPALLRTSMGSRALPVGISAAPYGGFAFLALIGTAKGLQGFEAAFEYGGAAAFKFGPLAGQGRITLGIYISQKPEGATIEGYFVAAGSAHLACFGVSACLLVSIRQASGQMTGSATFTFSFSLGLTDISYSVGVAHHIEQGWGAGSGQNSASHHDSDDVALLSQRRVQLADVVPFISGEALAPWRPKSKPARVRSDAVCMGQDWHTYRTYFDEEL